jgi:intracellular sulfur oxidation DsrE/DsrF family protein
VQTFAGWTYINQWVSTFDMSNPRSRVSHGQEQFSLLRQNEATYGGVHDLARAFLREQGVPVQVCGNHAGMYGHRADAYPDYVDVVDAAPGEIRRYRERGYEVVVVGRN